MAERHNRAFRDLPRLPDEIQLAISAYLNDKLSQAQNGLERAEADWLAVKHVLPSRRQIEYWKDCVSCIKWLLAHLGRRQRYLVKLTDNERTP